MPQARAWTDKADSVICSMRGAGATWAMIGVSLGLSRNTVIERGRRLQAAPPPALWWLWWLISIRFRRI
jgi:hypothetical protein